MSIIQSHIIKVNCECLKKWKNDNFENEPEIIIDLDYINEDLNYILENIELNKKSIEKIFEIKDEFLDELFFQTLFHVLDWWDNDKDENGEIIDIEYIKKCLKGVQIKIASDEREICFSVNLSILGLNEEDFFASHMLEIYISEKDNYKIEFNVC